MTDTRRSLNSLDDIEFAVRRIEELEAKLAQMLEIVRSHDTGDMRSRLAARRILEKLEEVAKETPSA